MFTSQLRAPKYRSLHNLIEKPTIMCALGPLQPQRPATNSVFICNQQSWHHRLLVVSFLYTKLLFIFAIFKIKKKIR